MSINPIQPSNSSSYEIKPLKDKIDKTDSKYTKLADKLMNNISTVSASRLKRHFEKKQPDRKGFLGRIIERINNLRMFGVRATNYEIANALKRVTVLDDNSVSQADASKRQDQYGVLPSSSEASSGSDDDDNRV